MKQFLFFLFTVFICAACKKESPHRTNWQVIDNAGNNLQVVNNKTEEELIACLSSGSCGTVNGGNVYTCNYYDLNAPKYCWNINGTIIGPMPQKLADCFGNLPDANRLPGICSSNPCERWYTRYKRTYKPTGQFAYSSITTKNYCNTDTIALFNNPIPIIIKDDADSLVLWQRSKTGADFY
jgi:hypothetical protein